MPEIPKSPFQGTPDQDADIFADLDVLAGEVVATAQNNSQTPEPVSPAPEKKSGQRSQGVQGENDKDAHRERMRSRWIKETGDAIAGAKTLEQLMKMVVPIEGKRGKKLDFPLPGDLLTLLKGDKNFSKEFNGLFNKWSNRVVEVLFNEDGVSRFQESLRGSRPETTRGEFFNEYLGRNLLELKMVPAVVVKMKNLWDKYYPDLKKENFSKRLFKRLVDTWRAYSIPFDFVNEKNGRKLIVTSIDGDHAGDYIEYDYREDNESEFIKCHITSSEIIGFLKGFRENFGIELISDKSISSTKNSGPVDRGISLTPAIAGKPVDQLKTPVKPLSKQKGKGFKLKRQSPPPIDIDDAFSDIRNNGNGRSDEDDEMRKAVRRQQSVPGKNGMGNPDTSKATTPDQQSDSLMRNYDDLDGKLGETKRGASLERKRLESAVAAGLQKIAESIPDETRLSAFVRDNKTDLVRAFSSSVLIRLEQLPWTPEEKQFFAETFVEKSIEDFLT